MSKIYILHHLNSVSIYLPKKRAEVALEINAGESSVYAIKKQLISIFIRNHVQTEKYKTYLEEQNIMPQNGIRRMEQQLVNESLRNSNFWEILLFDENNSSMASSLEDDNDPNSVQHRPVYACNNDYLPSNMEEINRNKSKLQEIRSERIENLKYNEFNLEQPDNPIHEAGYKFKGAMEKLKLVTCSTCHEKWFHELTPRKKQCERCAKEKK